MYGRKLAEGTDTEREVEVSVARKSRSKLAPSEKIVGRDRELEALTRFLAGAPSAPTAVVLQGEAGIGKTTLLNAGIDAAASRGFRVLAAGPAAAETQLVFAGLGDLLGDGVHDVLPDLPPAQRRALEVAVLLAEPAEPDVDRRAVGTGLLAALRELARRRPLLIAIDDVQWLDAPSATALEYAFRRLREEPISLLLGQRSERPTDAPLGLQRVLPEARLLRLWLGPFTLGAVQHLLRTRLGHSYPRPMLRRLWETSGGNPFFALELARELATRPTPVRGDALRVPDNLQDLVRERVALLPERVRRLLCVIAATPSAHVATIETVLGADGVADALDEAIAAGVIELERERIRFAHPLVAITVYAAIGPHERRRLHQRLAEAVTDPEQRARHLALATSEPSDEVARALQAAARRSTARGAPAAAAELAELALELTPPADAELVARRTIQAAEHHYKAGELARIRQLLEPLLPDLMPGRERSAALLLLAISREDDFDAAIELAEQALAEADGDSRGVVESAFFLSVAWLIRGDLRRAQQHARGALTAAELVADPALLAKAIAQLSVIETWTGEVTPGLLERGVKLEETLEDQPDFFSSPTAALGRRLLYADQLDEARVRLERALSQATKRGDEPSELGCRLVLTELECRAGRWSRAADHAALGWDLVEQQGLEQSRGALLYARALVDAHLGLVEQARAHAEEGAALCEAAKDQVFSIHNRAVLGFIALSLGDAVEADRHLAPLPRAIAARSHREPSVYPVLPNAIEAAIGVGDMARARDLVDRLEHDGRHFDSAWALSQSARCQGILAAVAGDEDTALGHFARALREHDRMPGPFERGRTLLALGTAQRRAKRKGAARESLEQALAIFDQLGAPLWAEKTKTELRRIGGHAPTPSGLTETERRVAELVAQGQTNREVAAALFVSVRAVEANLTRIYAKLGVRSRSELAHRFEVPEEKPAR